MDRYAGRKLIDEVAGEAERRAREAGLVHAAPAEALLRFAKDGSLGGEDDTGKVSVSPNEIRLQRKREDGSPDWSLRVSPTGKTAALGLGQDFEVGGSWAAGNPSGYARIGGMRLRGGYGRAPSGFGAPGPEQPDAKPGGWGLLSYTTGEKAEPFKDPDGTASHAAVSEAVSPYVREEAQTGLSARDELERELVEYRQKNPYWYRP